MKARFLLAALLVIPTMCKAEVVGRPKGSSATVLRDAVRLVEEGQCSAALDSLKNETERQPLWYEMMSQAYLCRAKRDGDVAAKNAAIAVLSEGRSRYPQDANLVLSTGFRYEELGDFARAAEEFHSAIDVAQANMTRGSGASRADAAVIQAAERELQRSARTPSDWPHVQQEALRLIAGAKCDEAGSLLDGVQATSRTEEWYELAFMAHTGCGEKSRTPAEVAHARQSLTDGLTRYPESLQLLSSAGLYEEQLGNRRLALVYLQRAKRVCDQKPGSCPPAPNGETLDQHIQSLAGGKD